MNENKQTAEKKILSVWDSLRDFLDDLQRTFFLGAAGLTIIKFSDRLMPFASWFPKIVGFALLIGASVLALLFGGGLLLQRHAENLQGKKGIVATTLVVLLIALLFWAAMWAAAFSLR